MAMGATLRALLTGHPAGRRGLADTGWQPPTALPEPPATLHPDAVDADTRGVLMQLAADMDEERFVPGLYRQLAHWPAYLAHIATLIEPVLGSGEMQAAGDRLRSAINTRALAVLQDLPEPPAPPTDAPVDHIIAAINAYQITSPQMVCIGRLLREALPGGCP